MRTRRKDANKLKLEWFGVNGTEIGIGSIPATKGNCIALGLMADDALDALQVTNRTQEVTKLAKQGGGSVTVQVGGIFTVWGMFFFRGSLSVRINNLNS